ncbi:MAG: hypothetical protein ABR585_03550 [Gemmatimonadaceae bacterium]
MTRNAAGTMRTNFYFGDAQGQTAKPTTDQDLQTAARELKNQIRQTVRQQIEAANGRVTITQGPPTPTPPATAPPPQTVVAVPPFQFDPGDTIPQQVVDISVAFFITCAVIIIGFPIARAFARRMDRRGAAGQISTEVSAQLAQLNQSIDAIALEVERISEGQRFTTRLLSEQREVSRQAIPSSTNR